MRRLPGLMTCLLIAVAACDDDGGGGKRDADARAADAGDGGVTDVRSDGVVTDAPGGSEGGPDVPVDQSTGDGTVSDVPIMEVDPIDLPPASGLDVAPREWMLMNDFDGSADLPSFWDVYVGGMMSGDSGDPPTAAISPMRGASRTAIRLMGPAVANGAEISVHHNFDWTMLFTGIRFWARATGGTQPTEVLVSLTDLRTRTELYHAGLRASRPWRVKRLVLTGDWQQFTVTFDELAPEGAGTPVPLNGTGANGGGELHFIVPENRAYDVWIDDVELGCRTGRCGPGFI